MNFFKKKNILTEEDIARLKLQTAKDWLPVKDVRDGIVHLKNGNYVKIIEVIPVNFKLKSASEKRLLMLNYRSFLKACKFPIQISIQCRKANVDPHVNRMKTFYRTEKNEQAKKMIRGYINLVQNIGQKGAITRRYYLIIPFVYPISVKTVEYSEVIKQLMDKKAYIKEFLSKCGNEVLDHNDNDAPVNIMYNYLNKRTSESQKIGKKLLSLMGAFLDYAEDSLEEEENENE